jgi:hypothetical protein
MMQMQMGMMMPQQGQQGWMAKTAFKAELGALRVAQWSNALAASEEELLARAKAARN